MTDLYRLQEQLQNYLLSSETDIQASIVATDKVPVVKRLAIYGDAYRIRLLEALANNYPLLKRYVGEDIFQKIGISYIDNQPSRYRSIRWFGDKFAEYLVAYDNNNNTPYLAELAQLEWHMTLAFDAAEVKVINIEDMAAIPAESWANVRFILHPSLHRLNFFWNIVSLWQALANDQLFTEELTNRSKPLSWVLWRNGYTIQFYALSDDETWALDAMAKGLSFSEICAGLCEWMDEEDVGMRAASLLKSWIQSGFLAQIQL
jgi:hypothetical protein